MWKELIIDLTAIRHNIRMIRAVLADDTLLMGVVKSDAYGHGMIPISHILKEEGVDYLGVAFLDEALKIRASGIDLPVVILTGIESGLEADTVIKHNFITVLYDMEMIEVIDRAARRHGKTVNIFLKVDTGMGRLGLLYEELWTVLQRIKRLKNINLIGLFSHLSCADDPKRDDFTRAQIKRFKEMIHLASEHGFELKLSSLSNSAGILRFNDSHFQLVRSGIIMYGGMPSPDFDTEIPFRQAMNLKGKIIQIRELPKGMPISYGATYTTSSPKKVAITSVGYGDGIPRGISNRGRVIIRERYAKILGRVCMNMTVVDVTHIEDVRAGDEVIFLGGQGDLMISADMIAKWAGTISYEIFCSIGNSNRKEYRDER